MHVPFKITVSTPPAIAPVTLDQVKQRSRIDAIEDDDQVEDLIWTATEHVEAFLGRSLITRTYVGFLDHWPWHRRRAEHWGGGLGLGWISGAGGPSRRLDLPRPPLVSVGYVKTYDDDDTATTMDSADYFVDTASQPGQLALRNAVAWPIPERATNGIAIQWAAGYGAAAESVPRVFRTAIHLLTMHLYLNPGAPEMPPGIASLLRPHRVITL